MNLLRILTVAAASATLVGCATNDNPQARAKIGQLREGMTQSQVRSIFGQPNKVDHDDGYHHGYGVPYYGWRGHGYGDGEQELTWEYDNPNLEVTFRRGRSGGWVVKEWDN